MAIKKQWDPVWVTVKATGEKACIKSYKFDPELHVKTETEEEVIEETAPEVEEVKEEVKTEELVCEACGKEAKSLAGLVSHKRFCKEQ